MRPRVDDTILNLWKCHSFVMYKLINESHKINFERLIEVSVASMTWICDCIPRLFLFFFLMRGKGLWVHPMPGLQWLSQSNIRQCLENPCESVQI